MALCGNAQAQTPESLVSDIDSIVQRVDGLRGLFLQISEGTIRPNERKKPRGFFADWSYTDSSSKKLLKVAHEESLFQYEVDAFYFHNDSLIFVRTSARKSAEDSVSSSGGYYFKNGSLIFRRENGRELAHPELFIESAKRYLEAARRR